MLGPDAGRVILHVGQGGGDGDRSAAEEVDPFVAVGARVGDFGLGDFDQVEEPQLAAIETRPDSEGSFDAESLSWLVADFVRQSSLRLRSGAESCRRPGPA